MDISILNIPLTINWT